MQSEYDARTARERLEVTEEFYQRDKEKLEIEMGELAMRAREAQERSMVAIENSVTDGDQERMRLKTELERAERRAHEIEENAVWFQRRCQDLEAAKFKSDEDVEIESVASSRTRSRRQAELDEEKAKNQRLEEQIRQLQAAQRDSSKSDLDTTRRVAFMPGIPEESPFLFTTTSPPPPPGFAAIGKDLSPVLHKRESCGGEKLCQKYSVGNCINLGSVKCKGLHRCHFCLDEGHAGVLCPRACECRGQPVHERTPNCPPVAFTPPDAWAEAIRRGEDPKPPKSREEQLREAQDAWGSKTKGPEGPPKGVKTCNIFNRHPHGCWREDCRFAHVCECCKAEHPIVQCESYCIRCDVRTHGWSGCPKREDQDKQRAQRALSHNPNSFKHESEAPEQEATYYDDINSRTGDLVMKAVKKIELGKQKVESTLFSAGEFYTGRSYFREGVLDDMRAARMKTIDSLSGPPRPMFGLPAVRLTRKSEVSSSSKGTPLDEPVDPLSAHYARTRALPRMVEITADGREVPVDRHGDDDGDDGDRDPHRAWDGAGDRWYGKGRRPPGSPGDGSDGGGRRGPRRNPPDSPGGSSDGAGGGRGPRTPPPEDKLDRAIAAMLGLGETLVNLEKKRVEMETTSQKRRDEGLFKIDTQLLEMETIKSLEKFERALNESNIKTRSVWVRFLRGKGRSTGSKELSIESRAWV